MNDTLKPTPANPEQQRTGSAPIDSAASAKHPDQLDQSQENLPRSEGFNNVFNWTYASIAGLTVLLVAQWWSSTSQISQLREELARRLQAADISNTETRTIAKSVLDTDKVLQVKIGVLESKLAESESHALALQQLYQDLSKNRDDWALSEIEQVLSTASQQLQLAGNVQGALIALQNADARLARSDKPQFITIRRSIAHDIDRLKALPNLDLPGIALRLDSAISQIESMPLWIDENPVLAASPTNTHQSLRSAKSDTDTNLVKKTTGKDASSKTKPAITPTERSTPTPTEVGLTAGWKIWLNEHWQSWSAEMREQIHQLIRIRDVENPDAILLTPSQGYFIKENIKLRLLNARLALLSRNETSFKSDMIAAQNEIARYFDPRAKQTQTVQALLRQIQNSNVSPEMPSLAESLNAVRNFPVKR